MRDPGNKAGAKLGYFVILQTNIVFGIALHFESKKIRP